jgi:hypothetical protein
MKIIPCSLILAILTACQSKQTVMLAPAGIRPAGASVQMRSTRSASIGAAGNLRQSETVKAYGMNRYIDVADSRVMHERHAIYRLEQQPAWITRSPKNQTEVILGPIVGLPNRCPEKLPGRYSRRGAASRKRTKE